VVHEIAGADHGGAALPEAVVPAVRRFLDTAPDDTPRVTHDD
jgi:hypothetical protein